MTDQDMEIWKAGFDLHNRHGDGPKTDAEWMSLVNDGRDMYNRFGGSLFAFHMALMLINYYGDKSGKTSTLELCEQTKIRM